eukprot:COSAG05_NODE_2018_length_3687_cov_38.539091_2_plen_136_part_00
MHCIVCTVSHSADSHRRTQPPCTTSVHTNAIRYRRNSLIQILAYEYDQQQDSSNSATDSQGQLYPGNRLDRVTSGLCVFATDSEAAAAFQSALSQHLTRKFYLARVIGACIAIACFCSAGFTVIHQSRFVCEILL